MATTINEREYVSTDNLDQLLLVLPPHIREALTRAGNTELLIEVVLDLGRQPEARYPGSALYLNESLVTREDIQYVASRVGHFTRDNRAGIERTLHRISAMRNRLGEIVGLTCRVGRAIYGTVDIIRDIVESGSSILIMGKPGVGKCITGDSLILTENGLQPLADLIPDGLDEDQFAPIQISVFGANGMEEASHAYNGGMAETIRITTRQGFSLEGTAEHPLLALTETGDLAFRRLDELKSGDYVAIQRNQQVFGNETRLSPFAFTARTNALDSDIPSELTTDLARFLGYLVAEGTLSFETSISFSNTDTEIQTEMERLTQSLFGLSMRRHLCRGLWNNKDFRIFGVKLRRFLEHLGLKQGRAADKCIPPCILTAPKPVATAFLQALFEGDGSIYGQGPYGRIEISSASHLLMSQVHIFLLSYGIAGNLRAKYNARYNRCYYGVTLLGENVGRFAEEIGFLSTTKKNKLAEFVAAHNEKIHNPNLDIIPHQNDRLRQLRARIGDVSATFQRFTRRDNRAPSYRTLQRILREAHLVAADPLYQTLHHLAEMNLYFDSVRLIEKSASRVYDICVPGSHSFFANGFVSHNTTLLREAARVLADDLEKRVIVVDTSNEIAGDGDVPHPGIGRARRMQVPEPDHQHAVMIEAVENHMPEVIVIDEIGTSQEALAARTIAERGVQLIATVHGNTLENLMINPTLSDLVGGIQPVTLSDEEARRRGTQKTVLERKAPPTFDVLIEIQHKDRLVIHRDVAEAVDQMLRGYLPRTEARERSERGEVSITEPEPFEGSTYTAERAEPQRRKRETKTREKKKKVLRIYPYAISRERLERAIHELGAPAVVTSDMNEADILLTLKSHAKRQSQKLREARGRNVEVHVVRANTLTQMENFLSEIFGASKHRASERASEEDAMQEVEDAVLEAVEHRRPVELSPQPKHIRRLQHLYIERSGLHSESKGQEPMRRIVIYPQ